jgi:hypothetical protein
MTELLHLFKKKKDKQSNRGSKALQHPLALDKIEFPMYQPIEIFPSFTSQRAHCVTNKQPSSLPQSTVPGTFSKKGYNH